MIYLLWLIGTTALFNMALLILYRIVCSDDYDDVMRGEGLCNRFFTNIAAILIVTIPPTSFAFTVSVFYNVFKRDYK